MAPSIGSVTGAGIVILIVAGVIVFAIAAGTVGREAHRLDALAPRTVYEIEQAIDFVADNLPAAAQARLTYDELEQLLTFHMRWLHAKGLQPDKVMDRRQDIALPIIVDETSEVAFLLARAEEAGMDVVDEDVAHVIDTHTAYFAAIGAVGPQANDPDINLN
uniref:Unannotated protein n=1 Tax=freshwater metagenome TaxID=449393 RepID=A0A6J7NTM0_9ZZZZ